MPEIEVIISSEDQRFFNALEHPEGLFPLLAYKSEEIGGALVTELQFYPPETEANAPGRFNPDTHKPMGFYERGRGWWYPVMGEVDKALSRIIAPGQSVSRMKIKTMTMTTRGAGKKMLSASGYKLRPTSQQLGENWSFIVDQGRNAVTLTVGNLATYSSYVQGEDQTELLRKYDWQTIEDVLISPFFMEVVRAKELEAITMYYHLGGLG